jgi:Na+-transporting NADH:ubiquinone oxidoreductase subunit C
MSVDSTAKTIRVALVVCLVCSVLVSTAAVGLRGIQEKNKELDKLKNILIAGDVLDKGKDVKELFDKYIQADIVDLRAGKILTKSEYTEVLNPKTFDIKTIIKDPRYSRKLSVEKDPAQIDRQPNYMLIYWVKVQSQKIKVILPIFGKGLWSTMYGLIALDRDLTTVKGFTFYEHGETPGLGGEVDNPCWKASWVGKKVFDKNGKLQIEVIKGKVNPVDSRAQYQVDGLSGATLTTRGINALVRFWLSENGYGPFIARQRGMQ